MSTSTAFRKRLRETFRLTGLAIRLTWQASPRLLFGIVVLVLLQALLVPIQLTLLKAVIDRIGLDLHLPGPYGSLAFFLPLPAWIALAVAAIALTQLIQPFSATFQSMASDHLTGYFEVQLIHAANRWRGLERFEDPGFADDLQRVRASSGTAGLTILLDGMQAAITLCTAVGLVLVLFRLHPLVPLLLVLVNVPRMAWEWDYVEQTKSSIYAQTPRARRLQYVREVMLSPQLATDVRLYGLASFFRQRYEEELSKSLGALESLQRRLLGRITLANVCAGLVAGCVYCYLVWQIGVGRYSIGDFAFYGGAATLLVGSLGEMGFSISMLPLDLGLFVPALARVLEAPPDLAIPARPMPAPRPIEQGIVFEDVHFSYPGAPEPVLRGVSFSIKPGETLALVGHNGAGKTTLIKLLLRMYDPTCGRILIDGVDLRDYDLDDLRRELGAIFQDFVRYELTARENVGLGQLAALNDRQRIMAAVEHSGADHIIESLPQGLETQLGKEFGGRELSGGQWQKLALARAFLRDCQLLVLDEPTAALDVQTEYDVYSRFHELTRDRMTLLISHRFSTIHMADRILLLEDGRIREAGNHEELMRLDGEYARLYRLQASQYLDESVDKSTQEEDNK